MVELRRRVRRLAPFPAPVLVTGETGTGKELVARALHDASPRSRGPYVALNASAIPGTLIASELFGHERGAFTGAHVRHAGAFEQASSGTLFLDEIAEMPFDLQAWLLRVLETGEVRALGGERPRRVDVRIICATHSNLEDLVERRRFRADLYWRLAVLEARVPPLRARREDIPLLAKYLMVELDLAPRYTLSSAALQTLLAHSWPGNVRELRRVLLRSAASAADDEITPLDVVAAIGRQIEVPGLATRARDPHDVLRAAGGNVSAAARAIGVPRTTFRDRVRSRPIDN